MSFDETQQDETMDFDDDCWEDDNNTGDWDDLDLVQDEDQLITINSDRLLSIDFEDPNDTTEECWECQTCLSINNVRDCINKHKRKCVGCQKELFVEFITPTIFKDTWTTRLDYELSRDMKWKCRTCAHINETESKYCTTCNFASIRTIAQQEVLRYSVTKLAFLACAGFVREFEKVFAIVYRWRMIVPSDIIRMVYEFYFIDWNTNAWIIEGLTEEEAASLTVGMRFDYKGPLGKWKLAEVGEVNLALGYRISFPQSSGKPYWASRIRVKYQNQLIRFAKARCMTTRKPIQCKICFIKMEQRHFWNHVSVCSNCWRIQNHSTPYPASIPLVQGDKVDINPIFARNETERYGHHPWISGRVVEFDDNVQVKVAYKFSETDVEDFYWFRWDNEDEIQPAGTRIYRKCYKMSDYLPRFLVQNGRRVVVDGPLDL